MKPDATPSTPLALIVELRLDPVCDRFEEAWAVGRPAIEDFLDAVAEPDRPALLRELIRLDVHHRRKAGEEPRPEEYCNRFPDLAAWLPGVIVAPPAPLGPASLPEYELLEELGRGGMGVVCKARHRTLGRLVAIKKMLTSGQPEPEQLLRFQIEAETVAALQHPNIVQLFEVGTTDGQPFVVLEYVEGGTLGRALAGRPLLPRDAAALVETLARAVQHAHDRGVVHRDLKPGNVLLQAHGLQSVGFGVPKIADFGLAKRAGASLTGSNEVLGTPAYMAPEQAMAARSVTTAADVYGLGAILYECLTGRPPFKGDTPLQTLQQVVANEPVPPRAVDRGVPHDLETICLKCLRKEPQRRYATAKDLADDLRRFLDGEPVAARPVGPLERAARWVRRRPALASMAGLTAWVAVVGFGLVLWQWRRAEREWRRAETNLELESAARARAERALTNSNVTLSLAAFRDGKVNVGRDLLAACPEPHRFWDWRHVKHLCDGGELLSLERHSAWITAVAFSPDGRWVASADNDRTVRAWDATTGAELWASRHSSSIWDLAISPDGNRLAIASASHPAVVLWDATSGKQVRAIPNPHTVAVRFHPREPLLVTGTMRRRNEGGEVRAFDLATDRLKWRQDAGPGGAILLAVNADGTRLAWGGEDGAITLANWGGVGERRPGKTPLKGLALSGDGKLLAVARSTAEVLDGTTGEPLRRLEAKGVLFADVAFAADGRLATAGNDDAIVWNPSTGERLFTLRGHTAPVRRLAFGPDGRRLVTGEFDGFSPPRRPAAVKVWRARGTPEATVLPGFPAGTNGVVFTPDGFRLVAGAMSAPGQPPRGSVGVWELKHPQTKPRPLPGYDGGILSVTVSAVGGSIAAGCKDGAARVWVADELRATLGRADGGANSVAFSPDGRQLAVGGGPANRGEGEPGSLALWDVAGQRQLWSGEGLRGPVNAVAFSPDGARVAAGLGDRTARVWDVSTGSEVMNFQGHRFAVHCVAFSPDGKWLAAGDGSSRGFDPGEVCVWDTATGREVHRLRGHTGGVSGVSFSPDGERVASAGWDGAVKVWDCASGQAVLSLRQPPSADGGVPAAPFNSPAFSPDGGRLAAATWRAVLVWETTPPPD